jgi:hypothetical protein
MNKISYKFNLTLLDQTTIIKAFDVIEEENKYCKIILLSSDYSKADVDEIFNPNSTSNFKSIVKTSKEAIFIRKYENYVGIPSVYEGTITVPVEHVEEINSTKEVIDENGSATTIPVVVPITTTKDVSVNVIFVELPYISLSNQKIAELEAIVNPKLDIETATLDEVKIYVQKGNSKALETFLENNPMLHTDGKYYGVAECDRNEMTQQYVSYMLNKTVNPNTEDIVKWHSKGTKCTSMPLSEFVTLALAISSYTEPYYEEMQAIKESIMNAETKDEVLSITIFSENS